MTTVVQGQSVSLVAEFYEYGGGPAADVTGLTITITPLAGGAAVVGPTAVGITHPATGLYAYEWDVAADASTGGYAAVWNGLDGGGDAVQASEVVTVTDGAESTYATLAQLRDRVGAAGITDRDDALQSALNAAARAFDKDTGRRPGGFELAESATARTYRTRGRVVRDVDGEKLLVDEFGSTTGLVVEVGDGTTWTAVTDYEVDPPNALADLEPVTGLLRPYGCWSGRLVRVTALWGWPAVPDQAVEAVLIGAHRLYGRKDSPDGIAAGASDLGGIRLARADPDYVRLAQALTLPGIA